MGLPRKLNIMPKQKDLYNPDEGSIYPQYVDANNLYGWAMVQKLPTHGFKWK